MTDVCVGEFGCRRRCDSIGHAVVTHPDRFGALQSAVIVGKNPNGPSKMHHQHEIVQFLSASPHRFRLLEHLRENPCSPSDITGVLDLSRRSVQRNLSALADQNWVTKTDGRYQLTTSGALVALQYTTFLEALETIERCEPFLAHLPDSEHVPDLRWLTNAELVVVDSSCPYAPMMAYTSHLYECSTEAIRGTVPVLNRFHANVHTELLDRGVETELVLPRAAAERARSGCAADFKAALRSPGCDLYVHDGPIEVGVTLTDRRGFIGAYDDHGRLCACVHGTSPELRDWAARLYERYRDRSCPLAADLAGEHTS